MSSRSILTAFALLCLGVSAQAAPKIDPTAKTLLTQMAAAENALTSYSGTITITDNGSTFQDVLKVKKPNLVSLIASSGGAPQTQSVSDGINLFTVDYGQKKYSRQPVPPSEQTIATALGLSRSLLATLIAQPTLLSPLLQDLHTRSVMLSAVNSASDPTVQTVVVKVVSAPGANETISFQIGRADHLLHGLNITVAGPGRTMTHSEVFTGLQVNPIFTADDFTFTPPPGIVQAASPADMEPAMYDQRLKVGADPFPISAKDLSGKPVALDTYKGKVVLLDFWATWCGPCRGEIPNVVAAYNQYHAQGFDIVGVTLDQANDRMALEKFLTQNHMTWRQIYDGGYWKSKVAVQYGVQGIPFSLLIGKDGKISALGDNIRGPELAPAIRAALAQKATP